MRVFQLCFMAIMLSGCGVWFAEWQGDINKTTLKANGEAALLEAESSKKIAIESAKAQYESAKLLALAEVERAKGVAEANRIVGDSLKGNEAYLKYLYIDGLKDKDNVTTIYVPTEAGLPILEARNK